MTTQQPSPRRFPLGSEWRRWDLHVHTPESVLENGFGSDWEAYLTSLEEAAKAHSIAVIGVTDYFTIDGYKKLLAHKANGRLTGVHLLIPNLEFRITPQTAKGHAINIHLLVSPEAPDHVEQVERALSRLMFKYDGTKYGCSRAELVRLGRAHDPEQTDEFGAYKHGIEIFKPDFSTFAEWYQDSDWLKSNALVAISNGSDGASGLSKDSGFAGVREELYRFSDVILSSREEDRRYFLGLGTDSEDVVRQKARSLKPCICGSDAHHVERLFEHHLKRYCWIKADPTFEGLRQIVHEPSERVWIGPTPPRPVDDNLVIDAIVFKNGAEWFTETVIGINPGLVAIIGEKGSGKTAIVDLAAYATSGWDGEDSLTSFIAKAEAHLRDLSVEVKWRQGRVSEAHLWEEPPMGLAGVRYLSQDFVEKLCSDDTSASELVKAIEEVVFSHLEEWERLDASDFTELRRVRIQHLEERRTSIREALSGLNKDIDNLRVERATRDEKVKSIGELEAAIKALDEQLPASEVGVDKAVSANLQKERETLQARQAELSTVNRALTRANGLQGAIDDYRRDIVSGFDRLKKAAVAAGIPAEAFAKHEPTLSPDADALVKARKTELEGQAQKLRGSEEKPDPAGDSVADIQARISALEKQLATDEQVRSRLVALQGRRNKADTDLKRLQREVNRIDTEIQVTLEAKYDERWSQYLAYFGSLKEEREALETLYQPVTKALESAEGGAQSGFELHVKQIANSDDWLERGRDLFDQRNPAVVFKQTDLKARMERLTKAWNSGDGVSIRKQLTALEGDLGGSKLNSHATPVAVDEWLYSPEHIGVEYGLRFEGTDLSALSPGQRGIVLLVLYLELGSNDNRPLIIDQPEGNLDNASIYRSLVPYLRRAKARRQIILVTHNPNLVVGTDVDQVIIATAKKAAGAEHPIISYRSGSLEDAAGPDSIRELVCRLLEGGREAFKLRETKYALDQW